MRNFLIVLVSLVALVLVGHRLVTHRPVQHPVIVTPPAVIVTHSPPAAVPYLPPPAVKPLPASKPRAGTKPRPATKPLPTRRPREAPNSVQLEAKRLIALGAPTSYSCATVKWWAARFNDKVLDALSAGAGLSELDRERAMECLR